MKKILKQPLASSYWLLARSGASSFSSRFNSRLAFVNCEQYATSQDREIGIQSCAMQSIAGRFELAASGS
jgi:hypothetical protein